MSRRRTTSALLLSMILLAACGGSGDGDSGGSGGSASSKALDACELLTKDQVAEAIGEPVSNVDGQGTPDGAGTCSWYGTDTGKIAQKGVTLIAARDNGEQRLAGHRELFGDAAKEESDFGDEAFTDGEIIAGREGDAFVVISPLYNDAGVTLEQVKPLGASVLDDLA